MKLNTENADKQVVISPKLNIRQNWFIYQSDQQLYSVKNMKIICV